MGEEKERKKVIHRSPGYPVIGLEDAINKATILYNNDKLNPIPKDIALRHLKYSKGSGFGMRILAALKQFNLLSDKKGSITLTKNLVDLIYFPKNEEGYKRLLRETALKPKSYSDIYSLVEGSIPSNDTLKHRLISEYKFNPDNVNKFIVYFKKTLVFAGIIESDEDNEGKEKTTNESEEDSLNGQTEGGGMQTLNPKNIDQPKTDQPKLVAASYNIPLLNKNNAMLTFQKLPIEKKDLERVKQWIDLMLDPLTENKEDSGE